MKTWIWKLCIICLFCSLGVSCDSKKKNLDETSFSYLMGKELSLWQFVKTREDHQNLELLGAVYEKNELCKAALQKESSIPKTIHFIWVGPRSFPDTSIKNVVSWIENNPGFKCKFWTDRVRPLPHPSAQLQLVTDFNFHFFEKEFEESDNYAEKSDLLRYEILYEQGGIYVDHDVECFKSFKEISSKYDLFCGIEPPHKPVMSSSVSICNNLIGARSHHPVLKETIDQVLDRWERVKTMFHGSDNQSTIYRIAHRTFSPFDESFKAKANHEGNCDIAFPAAFFNKIEGRFGLYSHHFYDSTWFDSEPAFEKLTRRRLVKICKKNNQILLFNALILGMNLFLLVFLLKRKRRA